MKITIDTKEDSHEEIRKLIKMLSSLVGEQEVLSNQADIFDDSGANNQNGSSDIFNIFNNSETKTDEEKTEDDKEDKEGDDINIPELEEYR